MEQQDSEALQSLIQFMYRLPVGLLQVSDAGEIEMLNPMSAQLLMPLAENGNLTNIFPILDRAAPQLRTMLQEYSQPSGIVCEAHRIDLPEDLSGRSACKVLSVSILKLASARLMFTVSNATVEVQREKQTLARRLNDAARVDSLTSMPNRRAICEELQRRLDRLEADNSSGFSAFFINCDRFKHINDAFGQSTGDEVLLILKERLRKILRRSDDTQLSDGFNDIAARISSDEFVLLISGLRAHEDVNKVAQRVIDAVSVPYVTAKHKINLTASMGVVMVSGPLHRPCDPETVLQNASIAMSDAKRAGGAQYLLFDPAMRAKAAERGSLEVELRRAIAEHELFVVYQPVVGVHADGDIDRCAGVEALVRWRHPVRGIVSPVEFIGIAEECGMIGALGDFVLERACRDFVQWQHDLGAFAPRMLSVNLSRAQLAISDWHKNVEKILRLTGMAAEQLQLEITESLAAQDMTMQDRLRQLKTLGLQLALDDFGTGYSSLACLHLLPVDTVKIDRSFVSKADVSAHHRVLIEATVRVAHSLGMNTVAEGIETHAQADVIRQLSCDKGQGYLFSRPLPANELAQWVSSAVVSPHMME